MNDIEQLTRGWRKIDSGREIVQPGDCIITTFAGVPRLHPCSIMIGCAAWSDVYRRTDADLLAMLSRASMWIRTAGEHGLADEINDLIQERT